MYTNLTMPPPATGKRRFSHCQQLYEDIHQFIMQRKWAQAPPDAMAGGITWTEVFALFRY